MGTRTFTMEGPHGVNQSVGGDTLESGPGAFSYGRWYEVGREPELNMSDLAMGTRGVANFVDQRRQNVGFNTGHLLVRRPHIRPTTEAEIPPSNFIG